jgi:type II secretory ATPase GspE/PulE/Tfp pilus assembly ATPase PilB-like protein
MGVEPYLAASVLEGAMAQRLGRRVCPHCRRTAPMPEDVSHRLAPDELSRFGGRVWSGVGCAKCSDSGYLGRIGFFELIRINPRLRRAISENRPTVELLPLVDEGYSNMRADGLIKAAEGLTTIEEVLRATQDTEDSLV